MARNSHKTSHNPAKSEKTGPKTTTPKHNKHIENRLWSRLRRGGAVKTKKSNPDDHIKLAAVCDSQVIIFGEVHSGVRPKLKTFFFSHYGAAKMFAVEYDEKERGA